MTPLFIFGFTMVDEERRGLRVGRDAESEELEEERSQLAKKTDIFKNYLRTAAAN